MDKLMMPQVPVNPQGWSPLKVLQYIFFGSFILYWGKSLFVPLSFALFISFVLYPVCARLERKGLNRPLSIGISITLLVVFTAAIFYLLISQLAGFFSEWPSLRLKVLDALHGLSIYISEHFHFTAEEQVNWLKGLGKESSTGAISIISNTLYSSGVWLVLFILIPIFSSLILYYRAMLVSVLLSFFSNNKEEFIRRILHQTVTTYYNFIKGMAIVYIVVGILNSVGLWIIGVPHPFLFGFIASVLTFIPYLGIIVASLFPIAISWLEYNSIVYPLSVVALFTVVQYLEANLIFPLAVSNKLNINTMVTIVMIVAGGILWGAAGMILFIPFIAIVKLIADNTEELKPLSRLLGTKNR